MKLSKIVLFPFSLIYGGIIFGRNWLYDHGVFKSSQFDIPVIGVGNIAVGGTGKSPLIEYMIRLLQPQNRVSVLSRGFGRRTRGYLLANTNSGADDIGDEPAQFKFKFPEIKIAVGEKRALAIPELLADAPDTNVILLDDAFQHRAVKPGLSIMLTKYDQIFKDDCLLPSGRLREWRSAYKRADVIIVSKCPEDLPEKGKKSIIEKIKPLQHQNLFFSYLKYNPVYSLEKREEHELLNAEQEVILICGIADTMHILEYVQKQVKKVHLMKFKDHHFYSRRDLAKLKLKFDNIKNPQKLIITSEKDGMRLLLQRKYLQEQQLPIYCLPIEVKFHKNLRISFDHLIQRYINNKPFAQ